MRITVEAERRLAALMDEHGIAPVLIGIARDLRERIGRVPLPPVNVCEGYSRYASHEEVSALVAGLIMLTEDYSND